MAEVIKFYMTDGVRIYEHELKRIIYDLGHIAFDAEVIGKSVFTSRTDAKAALERMNKNAEKQQ